MGDNKMTNYKTLAQTVAELENIGVLMAINSGSGDYSQDPLIEGKVAVRWFESRKEEKTPGAQGAYEKFLDDMFNYAAEMFEEVFKRNNDYRLVSNAAINATEYLGLNMIFCINREDDDIIKNKKKKILKDLADRHEKEFKKFDPKEVEQETIQYLHKAKQLAVMVDLGYEEQLQEFSKYCKEYSAILTRDKDIDIKEYIEQKTKGIKETYEKRLKELEELDPRLPEEKIYNPLPANGYILPGGAMIFNFSLFDKGGSSCGQGPQSVGPSFGDSGTGDGNKKYPF